jgi:ADP-heptose:LPS heptosyltransferase
MKSKTYRHIIISRTDAIGDVVLTLPMVQVLKELYKDVHISFIGKSYTIPILNCCTYIDEVVLDVDFISGKWQPNIKPDAIILVKPEREIAKAAKNRGIKLRVGTSHRLFHFLYANKLVNFSRKKSDFHEMELNFKLLKPFTTLKFKKEEMVNHYRAQADGLEKFSMIYLNKLCDEGASSTHLTHGFSGRTLGNASQSLPPSSSGW